jgi:hypothetical protein
VGGSTARTSDWLDRLGGLIDDNSKTRAREILLELREEVVSEAIQRTIGMFPGLSETQVLLAILCEYAARFDKIGASRKGEGITEGQVRSLWRTIESSRTPYRRRYNEQCAREYSNALRVLSQRIPSLMPAAWRNGAWEDGIPRTARGVKNRVSRLRALGNCVVPAQAYPIFRAITEEEGKG